jgi:UDP-N-acetyl-D-mannosaminuronate dehydrogenase
MKPRVLVVGLGEIGRPLMELLGQAYEVHGKDLEPLALDRADVLHVCYPYQKETPTQVHQWLRHNLKASVIKDIDLLEVRLPGDLEPEKLREALSVIISLAESKLRSGLQANIDLELARLSTIEKAVQEQLDAVNAQLQSEIARRKGILEAQRAELLARTDEIRKKPAILAVSRGRAERDPPRDHAQARI